MRPLVFRKSFFYKLKEYLKPIIIAFLIGFVIRIFVVGFYKVPSVSMQPTLLPGDHIAVFKMAYKIKEPDRGDIVIIKKSDDFYVKRIIALPWESVDIKKGDVIVEGRTLKRTFDRDIGKYKYIDDDKVVYKEFAGKKSYSIIYSNVKRFGNLPKKHKNTARGFFLLGDNRTNSVDSREWGEVDRSVIMAKVFFVWFSMDPETKEIRWDRIGRVK